jgi:hypothetical protein
VSVISEIENAAATEVFKKLSSINVNEFVKGKNGHKFLSWSHAINELLKVFPDAVWEIREWDSIPYLQTPAGCFVEVSVIIRGITRKQLHPILDYRNKPISNPDAFQINTSIMRALTKAISLHGMGLYIYQGEDLPVNLKDGLIEELTELLKKNDKYDSGTDKILNNMSVSQLEKKTDEYKTKESKK